jgi:hypothetical protein
MKLKAGDRVSCKLKQSVIVSPYDSYDDIRIFEIIGVDFNMEGYYLFVPSYIFLKNSAKIDNYNFKKLNINSKYIDEEYVFITEKLVCEVSFILKGASCKKCQIYSEYAEPNQDDGTLICYSCRANPYR